MRNRFVQEFRKHLFPWRCEMKKLLRLPEVEQRLCCKKGKVYKLIRQGRLNPPVKFFGKTSVWPEAEISALVDEELKKTRGEEVANVEQSTI